MRTNKEKLVMQQVNCQIHHPSVRVNNTGFDGISRSVPGTGGITYNFKIGDNCIDLVGDHVEPGVSAKNMNDKENNATQVLSCVGNVATLISGAASGEKGIVTGTHGGVEHVFIYFDDETLDKLNTNDNISIKAYGQGLKLLDYPNIEVMNLDPSLLDKLNIKEDKKLSIGVTHIVPAQLMGSGLGVNSMHSGDYDIMVNDPKMSKEYNLNTLRFGDLVAIQNHSCINGPHYVSDALTIGVIVHSNSYTSGHGPGVCVLFTSSDDSLSCFIDKDANLINYLK